MNETIEVANQVTQNVLKMTTRASTYISFFSFNSPMHQRFLKDMNFILQMKD